MAIDTMTTRKGRFLLAVFILLAPMARAQRYSDWRIYRAPDGMAESACVSVTVGVNEKVITKHINADSISELDGYSIKSFDSPEIGRNRVYESSGGQLWTVSAEGLQEYRDGAWRLHPIPEIAKLFRGLASPALPLVPMHIIKQNRLLILLPDQLIEFNIENPDAPHTIVLQSASQTGLQKFLGMTIARDGSVWVSGPHGLELHGNNPQFKIE